MSVSRVHFQRATTNWRPLRPLFFPLLPPWAAARTARCHRVEIDVAVGRTSPKSTWNPTTRNWWNVAVEAPLAAPMMSPCRNPHNGNERLALEPFQRMGFIIKGKSSCQSIYSCIVVSQIQRTGSDVAIGPGQSSHISIKGNHTGGFDNRRTSELNTLQLLRLCIILHQSDIIFYFQDRCLKSWLPWVRRWRYLAIWCLDQGSPIRRSWSSGIAKETSSPSTRKYTTM